jgi:hypothetical protein
MCAGNVPCKDCAEKAAMSQMCAGKMGYANNILSTIGLGGLVGEQGLQATVTARVEIPDDLWLKLGGTIVAVVLLGALAYFGVKKLLKV